MWRSLIGGNRTNGICLFIVQNTYTTIGCRLYTMGVVSNIQTRQP